MENIGSQVCNQTFRLEKLFGQIDANAFSLRTFVCSLLGDDHTNGWKPKVQNSKSVNDLIAFVGKDMLTVYLGKDRAVLADLSFNTGVSEWN